MALSREHLNALARHGAHARINELRQEIFVQLATYAHDLPMLVNALEQYEPYAPWTSETLTMRASAYKAAGHNLQNRALRELNEYRRWQGEAVLEDMVAASAGSEEKTKGTAMIEKE